DDIVTKQSTHHTPEYFEAEHPLFIMYTSGTTGQPKGLVHTSGGYLAHASVTYDYLFANPDVTKRHNDVHWCTADLAWVTAHTYEIYGPLSNGATQVIYEGVPTAPHTARHFEVIQHYDETTSYTRPTPPLAPPDVTDRHNAVHCCPADRAWVTAHTYEIYGPLSNGATQVIYEGVPNAPHTARHFEVIQRYGVTSYYTAPTLLRSLMGWHENGPSDQYDLSSIRLIGTVGEAVNPEAWAWARKHIGRDTAEGVPMVDTWWQSETGSTIISPRQTYTTFKPGS